MTSRHSIDPQAPPLLEVDRLGVRFGGLVALDAVSFTVHRSEVVALIGPNGAGKTTLFNVLTGLVRPTAGRIRLCGTDIMHWRADQIRRQGISRTFQLVALVVGSLPLFGGVLPDERM